MDFTDALGMTQIYSEYLGRMMLLPIPEQQLPTSTIFYILSRPSVRLRLTWSEGNGDRERWRDSYRILLAV